VVNAAQLNDNGQVVVYIEIGSSPYLADTETISGFSIYNTTCVPNGNSVLACYIHGQIAQQHPNQTAYIIMNNSNDKAWFTVPEAEPHKRPCPTISTGPKARCCFQNPGLTAPCPD
jgi:hypothetical protein